MITMTGTLQNLSAIDDFVQFKGTPEEFTTLHKLNEILNKLFVLHEGREAGEDFTIQLNGILHSLFEFKLKK